MSKTNRKKEHGSGKEISVDDANEGTAARTRPFSYEEIMLRRKNKKTNNAGNNARTGDAGKLSRKDNDENVSGHSELDRGNRPGLDSDNATKHASQDTGKRSSKKKNETVSLKEGNLAKDRSKESPDLDAKVKDRAYKETQVRVKDSSNEKQSHHKSKKAEHFRYENEPKKKHSENSVGREKYRDSERVKSERETKRKTSSRDEEKNRQETERKSVKKHDSGKHLDSEPAERKSRKKDTSQSHYEGRPKRRRSRSRETRDRDRKSVSLSPRAQKRSHHEREQGEDSLHSSKVRRQHSDVDRKMIPSNGGYASNRHHSGHGSKLGGYSPRKRRTEAAIRTPSPTTRSPEKKSAGWDLPPTGVSGISTGATHSNFQQSNQTLASSEYEFPVIPNVVRPLSEASPYTLSMAKHVSVDSIQLTQSTRPLRRLYVENLPASASDKSLVECFNKFLLSSGANHIQGTQPCISCIINKEKGQALVEFITPEYATTALSFDGRSFSGSVVKVRRPKDFTDAPTGVPEKSVPKVVPISDMVRDSPNKIFIGGISKVLSPDMLKEIVCAFGALKAYRFNVSEDSNEPCAFLEYMDQSITLKACAGLNGMKLGGQVLTVVQAVPDAAIEENGERPPFYGIPEHAKPLLSKPTKVLKLKNVFALEDISSMSGADLEETLEDIRLECARFGTVRSVNVVTRKNSGTIGSQVFEATKQIDLDVVHKTDVEGFTGRKETAEENMDQSSKENGRLEVSNDIKEPRENVGDAEDSQTGDPKPEDDDLPNRSQTGDPKPEDDDLPNRSQTGDPKPEDDLPSSSQTGDLKPKDDLPSNSQTGDVKPEDNDLPNSSQTGDLKPEDDLPSRSQTGDDYPPNGSQTSDLKPEVDLPNSSQTSDLKPEVDLPNSVTSKVCHFENGAFPEVPNLQDSVTQADATENQQNNAAEIIQNEDSSMKESIIGEEGLKQGEADGKSGVPSTQLHNVAGTKQETSDRVASEQHQADDINDVVFEHGCIFVEYLRTEASCMAAHCLHGRLYGDYIVSVNYVPHDLYLLRFPK